MEDARERLALLRRRTKPTEPAAKETGEEEGAKDVEEA
jgi:hypothetical protein